MANQFHNNSMRSGDSHFLEENTEATLHPLTPTLLRGEGSDPQASWGLRSVSESLFAYLGPGTCLSGLQEKRGTRPCSPGAWPAGSTPQAGVITLLMLLLSQGHAPPQAWKSWTCSPSCNETLLPRPQPGALITHLIIIFGGKHTPPRATRGADCVAGVT